MTRFESFISVYVWLARQLKVLVRSRKSVKLLWRKEPKATRTFQKPHIPGRCPDSHTVDPDAGPGAAPPRLWSLRQRAHTAAPHGKIRAGLHILQEESTF